MNEFERKKKVNNPKKQIIIYRNFLVILYFSLSFQLLVSNPLLFFPLSLVIYIYIKDPFGKDFPPHQLVVYVGSNINISQFFKIKKLFHQRVIKKS